MKITHHKNGEIKTLVEEAPYHPGYEDAVPTHKMTVPELIKALDDRYGNPYATECAMIQEAIKQLQFLWEDNKALREQVK